MTTCSKVPTMREAFDNRDFFWFMSPEQIEQQKRGKDQVTSVRIDGHTKDAIRQLLNYLEDEERDYMERYSGGEAVETNHIFIAVKQVYDWFYDGSTGG